MTVILDFDRTRYDFAGLVRARLARDGLLGAGATAADLETLRAGSAAVPGWSIYKMMEQAPAHRAFLDVMRSPAFAQMYGAFVKEHVAPLFDRPIRVQQVPTPRIVFADQQGCARFHRDCDYGHDPAEVNFQVALTPSFAGNAMWIESARAAADYRPAALDPGQMLMFDGANLSHGAMPNDTNRSRLSFDFRAIRESDAGASHRAPPLPGAYPGAHDFMAIE